MFIHDLIKIAMNDNSLGSLYLGTEVNKIENSNSQDDSKFHIKKAQSCFQKFFTCFNLEIYFTSVLDQARYI